MRSSEALLRLVDSISPDVEALGFAGIGQRLGALRVALAASMTQAAA